MKNIFSGSEALRNYLDMEQHEPTSCVELPPDMVSIPGEKSIRVFLKMMGPEMPLNTFKLVPTFRWFIERWEDGILTPETTVIVNSSGGAGLAAAVMANLFNVKIIVMMPEDTPPEKQRLIRSAMGKKGELLLTKDFPGEPTGVEVAREMGQRKDHLTFDQYADDVNWEAHRDITISQIFEQMGLCGLRVGAIGVAMGTTGTLLGAREFCRKHSPQTLVLGVMAKDKEPIPAVRSLKRLAHTQVLFDWEEGTSRVEVGRYESYQKSVDALRHGLKVGLSTGAAIVGVEQFFSSVSDEVISGLPRNDDGSTVVVVVAGDILDPYINQLRVILDSHHL